jgi:RNA polymerase sigma factor (sigma-70 family)
LYDHLRGRAVHKRALRKLQVEQAVAAALARAAAESASDLDALAFAVDEAFCELSLREQEAVRLRVVEERSYAEVARLLEIDPQAARMRVSRALRTLNIRLRDGRQ